jgi:hypothetical protein
LERLEGLFERHGGKAVFAARFFSVSRLLEALVAGMSRMPWGTFLFYSVLSGAVWATAVVLVGYFFGESWGSRRVGRDALPSCWFLYSGWRWASTSPTGGRPPAEVDRLLSAVLGDPPLQSRHPKETIDPSPSATTFNPGLAPI